MVENDRQVYWHKPSVTAADRREQYNWNSCVLWFTGLPSSGKSTLANALCRELHNMRIMSYVLDGDNIRHGLNKDLGFSPEDRKENIRRIGEVASLFVDAGVFAMTAFISPYREDRMSARKIAREGQFIEVFVKCAVEDCERRDPKGMYKKAREGAIKQFTGVSAPYEEPEAAEIVLETAGLTVDQCVEAILKYLVEHNFISQSCLKQQQAES